MAERLRGRSESLTPPPCAVYWHHIIFERVCQSFSEELYTEPFFVWYTGDSVDEIWQKIKLQYPHEPEFIQAVEELLSSLPKKLIEKYRRQKILERLVEPDRIVQFRVTWLDDNGEIQINRGWRVQWNNSIGPYKGGLRFHPTVTQSVLKFLAFEQTFKNALTGLPLGGGKGGSDFNPKGKSENEIKRFCEAFMAKLFPYIGHDLDVPAGDIGVGSREIGFMFEKYKKLGGQESGTLTGKPIELGGSFLRPEATGYGLVYFLLEMLKEAGQTLSEKTCLISGSGNVAQYTVEKLIGEGARVVTMSDSDGYIFDEIGFNKEKLDFIMNLKNNLRGRIEEYIKKYPKAKYVSGKKPWEVVGNIAIPCATQNEITGGDARQLVSGGVQSVCEGANLPSTKEAVEYFTSKGVIFGPSKAANAGGVAVSGLEMEQNREREVWSREKVDERLKKIMKDIHAKCVSFGNNGSGKINYIKGANTAGFTKVAEAMLAREVL